ncbi:MarR family winged helix-turn-helix transcriptional regulator [Agromyces sp. NPDC056523]|uniref:MarR family winged helix-turn-helix transcriptional regulator n=1 Tax=Agromyces sp. NPDC056523 TaxID=3345850 RepID=UPI00366B06FC
MTESPREESDQDPVELIEQSLAALRRGGRGPGPHEHGHDHGPHAHRGDRDRSGGSPWGHGPRGGPWNSGRSGDAGDQGDGGVPPWSRRGPRGAWEFRAGPMASLRLLATLHAADRPMSVTELAAAIGVDQPRASRLVQAAVAEGLVVREADPEDARRTRIRLTESGLAAVHDATSHRRRAIEAALEGFTDEERAQFATLFARFARGLHPRGR